MTRGKILTEVEKGAIMSLFNEKFSLREISRKVNRSLCVVQNFLNSPNTYGNNKRSGRKRTLNNREKRKIVREASNASVSLKQLKSFVDNKVSRSTVWRTLQRSEIIHFSNKKIVPKLTARHKKARLDFAISNAGTNWNEVSQKSHHKNHPIIHIFFVVGCFLRRKKVEFRWS